MFVTRQYDGTGTDAIVLKSATLEYEAVKAHYKVRLSTRIFNKKMPNFPGNGMIY